MRPRHVLLVALVPAVGGCCLALRGARQPVRFASDPPGATVTIASGQPAECHAPCMINVKRSNDPESYGVVLDGRETYTGELIPSEEPNLAYIFPAVFDGLLIVPGIVDLSTHVMWNFPTAVHVIMPPKGQGAAQAIATQ